MPSPLNVATPLAALMVADPEIAAPDVPVPEVMATVTDAEEDVTRFP